MPCTLEIRLKPRAKRDQITVVNHSSLDVSVTAPPLENKANDHLIRLLSDKLDISKRSLRIIKGEHCRNKVIYIEDLSIEESLRRLQQ
ncbi:MAG: DUF167 domain-containing protein [Fibrobacter sp.]|nr:DUF167 domain-containing protein [Fibrobacter sp.]